MLLGGLRPVEVEPASDPVCPVPLTRQAAKDGARRQLLDWTSVSPPVPAQREQGCAPPRPDRERCSGGNLAGFAAVGVVEPVPEDRSCGPGPDGEQELIRRGANALSGLWCSPGVGDLRTQLTSPCIATDLLGRRPWAQNHGLPNQRGTRLKRPSGASPANLRLRRLGPRCRAQHGCQRWATAARAGGRGPDLLRHEAKDILTRGRCEPPPTLFIGRA
jgi:hypothetical protein